MVDFSRYVLTWIRIYMDVHLCRYSARPGRPPKRSPILHANPDTLEKLKKSRMETDYLYGTNRLLSELVLDSYHAERLSQHSEPWI